MKRLILASASPRRKQILEKAGYDFTVVPSDKEDESKTIGLPEKIAVSKAFAKASDVWSKSDKDAVVLGADTVVAYQSEIFGKPTDAADAKRILSFLSGKTHKVITGYAIFAKDFSETGSETTEIEFEDLSEELIDKYVASGLCFGKAGAYGIQDGYPLVRRANGDYDNVVGLPIGVLKDTLDQLLK